MKKHVEFRYYEIPDQEWTLALTGTKWHKAYGEGPDRLHFHNYYEVGICYEGEGEMTLGDHVLPFTAGCISVIPPSVVHTTNTYGRKARWEWLYFDMAQVMELVVPGDEIVRAAMRYQLLEKAMLYRPEECPEKLRTVLCKIFEESSDKTYLYEQEIRFLLPALVIEIIRMSKNSHPIRNLRANNSLEPAIEYVNSHYDTAIKISELAAACNMSESHFRKIFVTCMGMKPVDYINYIKIRKSCTMLKNTNLTVGEITSHLGYESQGTYIRNFKSLTGKTPLQWRKAESDLQPGGEYKISAKKGWME